MHITPEKSVTIPSHKKPISLSLNNAIPLPINKFNKHESIIGLRYKSHKKGSKPRKFITRTILTNPSLISLSVTSLLDPQNQSLPKIYNAIERKQMAINQNQSRIMQNDSPVRVERQSSLQEKAQKLRRQSTSKMDSLEEAERQFLSKKLSQPQPQPQPHQRSPLLLKKQLSKQLSFMSRNSSTPSILPSNFHYKNTLEIKQKQSKPYNIISNLS